MSCAISTTAVSFMSPAAEEDFNLNSTTKGILNGAPFLGQFLLAFNRKSKSPVNFWRNFKNNEYEKWNIDKNYILNLHIVNSNLFISIFSFLGMVLGAYFWGICGDIKGRRFVILGSMGMDTLCTIISCLTQHVVWFIVIRVGNGFA